MRFKTILFTALLLGWGALAQANTRLRLVLVDNSTLRGTLISNDSQVLTLDVDGQTKKIPVDGVKKAFDDSTGKPFDLSSSVSPAEEVEQAPLQRQRFVRRQRQPRELHLRSEHEWFDLDANWLVGALIGNDTSLRSFWEQSGLSYDNDSNPLAAALDFDALVRPLPWFAIGPFFTWNFDAPSADGTGVDSGGSGDSFRERMGFSNIAYGARAKIILPIKNALNMEIARVTFEASLGELSLNNSSFQVWDEGNLVQDVSFDGTTPYVGAGANFDMPLSRTFALQMGLGFQYARLDAVHYYFSQDNLNPVSEAGQSGTLTDVNGNNVFVDFSSIYFKMGMTFLF